MKRSLIVLAVLAFTAGVPGMGSAQTAVGAPTNVVVVVNGQSVSVAWAAPVDGPTATGYFVEFGYGPETTFAVIDVGTAQTFVTTLTTGTYVVRVRTNTSSGPGAASNDTFFGVGVPLAPTDFRAVFDGSIVTLTWNTVDNTPAPMSYLIEVGSQSGLSDLAVFDTRSDARSLRLNVAGVVGTFHLRVKARNAAGSSPASNPDLIITTDTTSSSCPTVPAAPSPLAATVSGNLVTLSWFFATGTPIITGFVIEVGSAPGLSDIAQIAVGAQSLFAAAASPGTYHVRVRGRNVCGTGSPSNEATLVVP
jgi:hypothetical protein